MRIHVPVLILVLLFFSTAVLFVRVEVAQASGTIYIRADGSIDPKTTNMTTVDNSTYTFTSNVNDSLVIERDNIVLDGAGYMLAGAFLPNCSGINITGRTNVTITNITVCDFEYGIYASGLSNSQIIANNVTFNGVGLYLIQSQGLTISDNSIENYGDNAYLEQCFDSTVTRNNITSQDFSDCININFACTNCTVSANRMSARANGFGCNLYEASNNTISDNVFTNCSLDIYETCGNTVSGNMVNGKSLVYLEKASNVKVQDAGQVILINCTGIQVENLSISNVGYGVQLHHASNCSITENNIADAYTGISVHGSANCTIADNRLVADGCGISLDDSANCSLSLNTLLDNAQFGVSLSYSYDCAIFHNNVTSSGPNSSCGLWVGDSAACAISRNNIVGSAYGISLAYSSECELSGNGIASSGIAVSMVASNDSMIFHNNFLNNGQPVDSNNSLNLWDDGGEGNYWSSYAGKDLDYDGIGDSQHIIDSYNIDNYPLMGTFYSFQTLPEQRVELCCNSTVDEFAFFEENSTIRMRVSSSAMNQTFGFCRMSIPHALMNVSSLSVVIDNGATPILFEDYALYDNLTFRWIYFAYSHSTHEIVVVHEFSSFLALPLLMAATITITLARSRKRSLHL